MARQIGSQHRETLAESGYRLVKRPFDGEVILADADGNRELWVVNDHHAGHTIQVGRWGYEFIRGLNADDPYGVIH
jgi:hypothetical protein